MSSNQPYPPDPRNSVYNEPTVANNVVRSSNDGSASAESQYQRRVDAMGNQVESREEVFEDRNQSRANMRYWVTTVTYFVLGVLEILLLLRFVFRLLAANPDNAFVSFLYNLSGVFVAPFNGIFANPTLGSASVFELSTLVAMLVYALIAWGIIALGRVIFSPTLPSHRSTATTRRSGY